MNKKRLLKWALDFTGKEGFQLDDRIPFGYILKTGGRYCSMLIRGEFFSFGHKNISKQIFVGRHVRVLCKERLFVGSKTRLHSHVYIDALSEEGVRLGERVVLGQGTRIECTGSLRHIGKGVRIGQGTSFGDSCFFGAAGGIEVGEDVIAGQFIRFHSEDHQFSDLDILIRDQGVTHKGIKVGNNCWIGSGAVFLDGARLGDGCVVAANAVVRGEFPANSVVGGVPAKLIRKR